METSETYFEQIPIETMKTIVKEFTEKNAIGSDDETMEKQEEVRSPRESWRELAQKVEHEHDPKRMMELIQRLIAAIDQENFCKRRMQPGVLGIVQVGE